MLNCLIFSVLGKMLYCKLAVPTKSPELVPYSGVHWYCKRRAGSRLLCVAMPSIRPSYALPPSTGVRFSMVYLLFSGTTPNRKRGRTGSTDLSRPCVFSVLFLR